MPKGKQAQAPLEIPTRLSVKHKFLTGQVSLELGAAFICIFLLLIASAQLCSWAVARIAYRQQDYEVSRPGASTSGSEANIDDSRYPKLNFFR